MSHFIQDRSASTAHESCDEFNMRCVWEHVDGAHLVNAIETRKLHHLAQNSLDCMRRRRSFWRLANRSRNALSCIPLRGGSRMTTSALCPPWLSSVFASMHSMFTAFFVALIRASAIASDIISIPIVRFVEQQGIAKNQFRNRDQGLFF